MGKIIKASNQLLIEKISEITNEMKIRCIEKDYFKNLNMNAANIIEFIVNDYIQCLQIYLQTKSTGTFKDKVMWFKDMAAAKMPLRNSLLDFLDFSYQLKDVTLHYINDPDDEILHGFNDFNEIVIFNYKEV